MTLIKNIAEIVNKPRLNKEERGLEMEDVRVQEYVNGKTLIGQVVNDYPEAIDVLMAAGMHCLGCSASQMESIEDAAMVHGIDSELLINAVNHVIDMKRN